MNFDGPRFFFREPRKRGQRAQTFCVATSVIFFCPHNGPTSRPGSLSCVSAAVYRVEASMAKSARACLQVQKLSTNVPSQLVLADFAIDASTQYTIVETQERLPGPSCGLLLWGRKIRLLVGSALTALRHKTDFFFVELNDSYFCDNN